MYMSAKYYFCLIYIRDVCLWAPRCTQNCFGVPAGIQYIEKEFQMLNFLVV
jgi:hypothetical protein